MGKENDWNMQPILNRNTLLQFDYLFITVAIVLVATDVGRYFEFIRFFKYFTVVVFGIILLKNGMRLEKNNWSLILPFFILVMYNIVMFLLWNPIKLYELFFIISAFVLFMVVDRVEINIKGLSVVCMIDFIVILGNNIYLDLSMDAFLKSQTSTGETNMLPFLFGLFTLFFLVKKQYLWFLLNFVFVILLFKRIVFLGVAACVFAYILPNFFRKIVLNRWTLLVTNCLFVVFFYFLAKGVFDKIIFDYTGLSIGHLTQGRSTFFKLVLPELLNRKYEVFFLGIGQGNLLNILYNAFGEKVLFHNDLFKMFVENGVVVFLAFFYFLYMGKNIKQLVLLLFFNLIFLTDNVLIYSPVLLLLLVLVKQFEDEPDKGIKSFSNN